MCGTLVRVEIERAPAHCASPRPTACLNAARRWCRKSLLGQAQGGFAMGVGYALLETLPPYEGGPGNGQWNLGQYLIARGSDLPLHDLEIEVLPPVTPNEPPKGMAEVVMIPVVAGAAQRHLRCHRPPLPILAGDSNACSRERSRDDTRHHDQRSRARPDGRARRSDDERFPARVSRA